MTRFLPVVSLAIVILLTLVACGEGTEGLDSGPTRAPESQRTVAEGVATAR